MNQEIKSLQDEVADLKEANEGLLRSSKMLTSIMNSFSDMVYMKDRKSRMVYCNPVTIKIIGKSAEMIYGKNDVEFLGPGNGGEEILKTDERIMSTGVEESTNETVTWADGSKRIYLSQKIPRRDLNGKVDGLIGISTDITDRVKIEKELELETYKLETLFREK